MKGGRDGKSAKTSATINCQYGAVVVNAHMYPRPHLHHFLGVKNDVGTGIHMIVHYNCTILVVALICHPYPPSFNEMVFILVPLIFPLDAVKLERQGAPKMLIRAYITHACTLVKPPPC